MEFYFLHAPFQNLISQIKLSTLHSPSTSFNPRLDEYSDFPSSDYGPFGEDNFYNKTFTDPKDPLFLETLGNPVKEDCLILEFYFGVPRYVAAQILKRMTQMYQHSLLGQDHMENVKDHGYFLQKTTLMNDYFMKQNRFSQMNDSYFHLIEPRPFHLSKFYHEEIQGFKVHFYTLGADLPIMAHEKFDPVQYRRRQRLYLTNLLEIDRINFNTEQKSISLALFQFYFDFGLNSENNDFNNSLGRIDPSSVDRTDFYVLQQYESNTLPDNSDIFELKSAIYQNIIFKLCMDTRIFLILSTGVYSFRLSNPDAKFQPDTLPLDTKHALESLATVFKNKYINENYLTRAELKEKASFFFDDRTGFYSQSEISSNTNRVRPYPVPRPSYSYIPVVPEGLPYPYKDLRFPFFDGNKDSEFNLGYSKNRDIDEDDDRIFSDKFNYDINFIADLVLATIEETELREDAWYKYKLYQTPDGLLELEKSLNLKDDRSFPQFQFLQQISEEIFHFEYVFKLRYYMRHFDHVVSFNRGDVQDYEIFFKFMFQNDILEFPDQYSKYPPKDPDTLKGFTEYKGKAYRSQDFVDYTTGNIFVSDELRERRLGGLKGIESGEKTVGRARIQRIKTIL